MLRYTWFLEFEAKELSKVPLKVPYMKSLIKDRQKLFERATRRGRSYGKYSMSVKIKYNWEGWVKRVGGRIKYDPWAMLRSFEDSYKDKNPDYVSPWQPRQRRFRGFMDRFERGDRKYPKGRYY